MIFSKALGGRRAALGSPSIRTHIERLETVEARCNACGWKLCRKWLTTPRSKNLVVHFRENDNPISEDPFFIVQASSKRCVTKTGGSVGCGALPDFRQLTGRKGHDEEFAYRAIDAMFAHAYGICHVKDGEVNEQGKAVHVDLARTFTILNKHTYKGYCSIEYDAPGDPYKPTVDLIDKTVRFLS